MGREQDVTGIGSTRLTLGLSTVFGITNIPGLLTNTLKYFSGGSLEIGGSNLTWGGGYMLGTSEVFNFSTVGTFYLCATGATVVAMLARGVGNNN